MCTQLLDLQEAERYRMRENAINERRNFFLETAKSLLDILDIETIAIKTGLSIDDIKDLK